MDSCSILEIHTNIQHRKNQRKGITPVLATIILIAITLIAAISVGGYVFGLFGSFTNTATVSVVNTSSIGLGNTITLVLSNSGNAATGVGSVVVNWYQGTQTCTGGMLSSVPAGLTIAPSPTATVTLTCTLATGTFGPHGAQYTGTVGLTNGGQAVFTGTFA